MAAGRQGDLLPQARHPDGRRRNGQGSVFQAGTVARLFEASFRTENYQGYGTGSVYDVAPDGQRFLINVVADGRARTNARYDCDELDVPPSGGPLRHMAAQHLSDLARSPEPG